jgi:uncharacterized protein (DUF2235 family)
MTNKNIAIFCDGTWQQLDQPVPTNVNRLARCVLADDLAGVAQVVRYDDGVGVGTGILNEATQFIGGAFGEGLENKMMQAYEFVCLNYAPGDQLFIFGFSRGAYTARCLAGLLHIAGILTREHADKVTAVTAIYQDPARRTQGPAKATADAYAAHFRETYCHPYAQTFIRYVGVWDTVGELGIPTTLPLATQVNDKFRFLDTSLSSFTRAARHAVAIDERRDTYKPTLWDNIDQLNTDAGVAALPYADRPYQQRWFPGHHSGVGGGQADSGLCLSALAWIAEGASKCGLNLDPAQLAAYAAAENPAAPFVVEPPSVGNFFVSQVGGESDRIGPTALDEVSAAARTRWQKLATWRPPTLANTAVALNASLDG